MLCEILDGRTRILLKKQGVHDIMSVSEPERAQLVQSERRMAIMCEAHDTIVKSQFMIGEVALCWYLRFVMM